MPKENTNLRARSCQLCQRSSPYISSVIGICGDCLRERPADARLRVESIHTASRAVFDLPIKPPRHSNGIRCVLCSNECIISENGRGFCGLRTTRNGKLVHLSGTPARGLLHWYRDPLPNCVADWVCEGSASRRSQAQDDQLLTEQGIFGDQFGFATREIHRCTKHYRMAGGLGEVEWRKARSREDKSWTMA